jgi:hypothetical protein
MLRYTENINHIPSASRFLMTKMISEILFYGKNKKLELAWYINDAQLMGLYIYQIDMTMLVKHAK